MATVAYTITIDMSGDYGYITRYEAIIRKAIDRHILDAQQNKSSILRELAFDNAVIRGYLTEEDFKRIEGGETVAMAAIKHDLDNS